MKCLDLGMTHEISTYFPFYVFVMLDDCTMAAISLFAYDAANS